MTKAAAEPPRRSRDAGPEAAPAPQPSREIGGDAVAEARPARSLARRTPARQGGNGGGSITPVRYARTVTPRYPRKARRAGWEGTTVLKVLVEADGAPGRIAVHRTSGFEVLDAAAVRAVRRWRFHPARRGADALSAWVRVPVAFRLKEVEP